MGFRTDSASSWPVYAPRPTGASNVASLALTFRANSDAGLVFVIGTYSLTSGVPTTVNPADLLPSVFRPLAPVSLTATNSAGSSLQITVAADGSVQVPSNIGTWSLRSFYFTSVTPG